MTFLLVALATFWAWEALIGLLPFRIFPLLQPFVVASLAYGLLFVPVHVLMAGAAAAIVALLHVALRQAGVETEPAVWWLPNVRIRRKVRASRLPKLP